uniref:Zinc finger NFX1-type containing 1 n=1 Tax=Sphenodon punctatus TaxID=8508 RepID=A0A8D0HIJ5_SPHPU
MDDRRPGQEPRLRQPNANWRGPANHQGADVLQRGQNRWNRAPGHPWRGAAQHGGNPRANLHPLPPGPRDERFGGAWRLPYQGRRNPGGAEQDNEGWRRRNDNPEGGRGRRIRLGDNPHFPQDPAPRSAQHQEQQQVHRIGYKFLESLLQKDPSEVVITLASRSGLKELLSQTTMRPQFLQLFCQVLQKACSSRMDRQSVQQLLGLVKESNFLRICLPQYVADMMTELIPAVRCQYPEHIGNILSLLQNLVSVFPASSVQRISMLMSLLPASINALRASGVDIADQTEKSLEKVQTLIQHLQEKRREGTLRADNYTLVQAPADGQEENYRTMSIYPTYDEMHGDKKPFLRPNLTFGRYESTNVYLDTHFRLLREDFVRPLREGILELLQSFEDKGLRKRMFDDIRIYFDTRIITPLCSSSGISYKVQFDTKPLKFVLWENSKRLLYGSLVCMSRDHFETFLFATVANRDSRDLKQGFVQLCFNEHSQGLLAEAQPSDSFLMVETTAYFEAYRHVLEGLQEIQEEDVPFQKYIVECDPLVQEPAYLRRGGTYDIRPLMEEPAAAAEEEEGAAFEIPVGLKSARVNILDLNQWPSLEALKLDESQMQALQLALTKELAIIQGPPGTGKTYVGLKIVQAFLTNETAWQQFQRSPVLVVCYTNHALDQFLEGIYKSQQTGIVRIGGRSSSEILKQFTLRELRNTREFRRGLPTHLRRAYIDVR